MGSGFFTFTTSNNFITGMVKWISAVYSTENNTSQVTVNVFLKKSTQASIATRGDFYGSISIDGMITTIPTKYIALNTNDTYIEVGSAYRIVKHSQDGTKTLKISTTGKITAAGFSYTNKEKTIELDKIATSSTVSGGSGNIGEKTTISIQRKLDNLKHDLYYNFGSISNKLIAQNVETSYIWTIPQSLSAQIPNSKSGNGTIICKTYSDSVYIGESTTDFTATIVNSLPIVTMFTYADTNSKTIAITQDNQRIIRNNSIVKFTIPEATAQDNATITKYELEFAGETKTRTTAGELIFSNPDTALSVDAILTVTDSRGAETIVTKNIIVDDWTLPMALIRNDHAHS